MSLERYKQKRDFKKTREPAAEKKPSNDQLIFVVQKHDARNLHYDFRLELNGVLKSWAVPKGPSLNPENKRLAMMVEDHPYDYKDFEGNIPEGNYGAGNVIVWDKGTYEEPESKNKKESEKKLHTGLYKGHLNFILHGEKLKGEFSLVKLKSNEDNSWLLIKKKDKYASDEDILKKNKSVLSKITLERLNDKSKKKKKHEEITIDNLQPMLAEIRKEPFDDTGWLFEIKYDGYRALAFVDGNGGVDLLSRKHQSFKIIFSLIVQELSKIRHSAVLDGEIVIEDKHGVSRFQFLQNYQHTGEGVLKYYVFDILNLNGNDTRQLPLLERKELLYLLMSKYKFKNIFFSEHVKEKGKAFFEKAVKHKYEGIMAKNSGSPYRSGRRTNEWLKVKIHAQQEAVITGITEPQGSRKNFGALLLGVYENNKLKYAGKCGTGFNHKSLHELYKKFQPYFTTTNPFAEEKLVKEKVQWIKPKFVCEVKFTEWTKDNSMRHPVFLGLREDKKPRQVVRETI